MDATELRYRIIAVFKENLVVELLGPTQPDRGIDGVVATDVEFANKLVEKEPSEAFGRTRVTSEQGALNDLGQIYKRKYRAVEVREIATKNICLFGAELFCDVDAHGRRAYGLFRPSPRMARWLSVTALTLGSRWLSISENRQRTTSR
ncbi:unannotated protein [freshwater metagenome]|uniref:Unannotated protein n=1 Tax=freshwater metagenome TaxID=449393 RepID=A0A6J6C9G7_9ZZZZ